MKPSRGRSRDSAWSQYLSLDDNKKVTSIVQVGTSLEDFDETMKRLLIIMIIGIPTSIASTHLSIGYFMAQERPSSPLTRSGGRP